MKNFLESFFIQESVIKNIKIKFYDVLKHNLKIYSSDYLQIYVSIYICKASRKRPNQTADS